ncbi:MAG: hypothetical protein PHG65_11835 [Kiritimatiellae bacterium]|nr:hypothetical protein [Kiritimatiellia bacterium]
MIPRADIVEWRTKGHPWQSDAMVEQDLLISPMLVELFNDEFLHFQVKPVRPHAFEVNSCWCLLRHWLRCVGLLNGLTTDVVYGIKV